jgi:hypothetical protein
VTAAQPVPHCAAALEAIFDRCFAGSEATRLRGGVDEPLYVPASPDQGHAVIWYREDYFASALHEVSHWCIAGPERRRLPDFGYWYHPDGRSPAQQAAFERVEVRPQALEWCLSRACGFRFRVSIDNLMGEGPEAADHSRFERAVVVQANDYRKRGLPPRAAVFASALARHWQCRDPLAESFSLLELRTGQPG